MPSPVPTQAPTPTRTSGRKECCYNRPFIKEPVGCFGRNNQLDNDGYSWDPVELDWCSDCECYCGDTGLYFGDTCEQKHNIAFNKAVAWIIIVVGLGCVARILGQGVLAQGSTNLQEFLLRVVLQKTRPTCKVEFPEGFNRDRDGSLQWIDDGSPQWKVVDAADEEPTNRTSSALITDHVKAGESAASGSLAASWIKTNCTSCLTSAIDFIKTSCLTSAIGPTQSTTRSRVALSLSDAPQKGEVFAYAREYKHATLFRRVKWLTHSPWYIAIVEENPEKLSHHEPEAYLPIAGLPDKLRVLRKTLCTYLRRVLVVVVGGIAGAVILGILVGGTVAVVVGLFVGIFVGDKIGKCVWAEPPAEAEEADAEDDQPPDERGEDDEDDEDKELLPHDINEKAAGTGTTDRVSEIVFVCIDVSGSMGVGFEEGSVSRLDAVKKMFYGFRDQTTMLVEQPNHGRHLLGLLSFNVEVFEHTDPPTEDFDVFEKDIDQMKAENRTFTYRAIQRACALLRKPAEEHPDANLRVFCLSDGNDTSSDGQVRQTSVARNFMLRSSSDCGLPLCCLSSVAQRKLQRNSHRWVQYATA